jgi:hypothetical protein
MSRKVVEPITGSTYVLPDHTMNFTSYVLAYDPLAALANMLSVTINTDIELSAAMVPPVELIDLLSVVKPTHLVQLLPKTAAVKPPPDNQPPQAPADASSRTLGLLLGTGNDAELNIIDPIGGVDSTLTASYSQLAQRLVQDWQRTAPFTYTRSLIASLAVESSNGLFQLTQCAGEHMSRVARMVTYNSMWDKETGLLMPEATIKLATFLLHLDYSQCDLAFLLPVEGDAVFPKGLHRSDELYKHIGRVESANRVMSFATLYTLQARRYAIEVMLPWLELAEKTVPVYKSNVAISKFIDKLRMVRTIVPLHPVLQACVNVMTSWHVAEPCVGTLLPARLMPLLPTAMIDHIATITAAATNPSVSSPLAPSINNLPDETFKARVLYEAECFPIVASLPGLIELGVNSGAWPAALADLDAWATTLILRNIHKPNEYHGMTAHLPWKRALALPQRVDLNTQVAPIAYTNGHAMSRDPYLPILGLCALIPTVNLLSRTETPMYMPISGQIAWTIYPIVRRPDPEVLSTKIPDDAYLAPYGANEIDMLPTTAYHVLIKLMREKRLSSTDARARIRSLLSPKTVRGVALTQTVGILPVSSTTAALAGRTAWRAHNMTAVDTTRMKNDLYGTSASRALGLALGGTIVPNDDDASTALVKFNEMSDDDLKAIHLSIAREKDETFPINIALRIDTCANAGMRIIAIKDGMINYVVETRYTEISAETPLPPLTKTFAPVYASAATIATVAKTVNV